MHVKRTDDDRFKNMQSPVLMVAHFQQNHAIIVISHELVLFRKVYLKDSVELIVLGSLFIVCVFAYSCAHVHDDVAYTRACMCLTENDEMCLFVRAVEATAIPATIR